MEYNRCLLERWDRGNLQGDEWEMQVTSNEKKKTQEINKSSECDAGARNLTAADGQHR